MIDKTKCYEILGVRDGVSREELKTAHRDLAKVWHPDRFAHDPRLQAKAQEKLKEINDAFDQLTSGKAKRKPVTSPRNGTDAERYYHRRGSRSTSHSSHWWLVVVAVLIFGVVFFFTLRSIRRNQQPAQGPTPSIEQTAALEIEDPSGNPINADRNDLSREKNRNKEQSAPEQSVSGRTIATDAAAVQPVEIATVTIDPLTGKVARRECPTKRTMTYPKGNEPNEYCNVHKPLPPLQAERESPKESRIKSVTRRLVSPSEW